MAELKSILKNAKQAIKDKDYEAAMIHCKDALRIDRRNYQALAIFGRVCQEQKMFLDSKKALLCATQIDPENPVAWQGLLSLLEKDHSIFAKDEELDLLTHFKQTVREEEKLEQIIFKLAAVYQRYESPSEAVTILESYVESLKNSEDTIKVHNLIINIIQDSQNFSQHLLEKLILHYEAILNDSTGEANESNFKLFLKILYKNNQYKKTVSVAQCMYKTFHTAYPLEWIARIFVECSTKREREKELLSEVELKEYIDKLLILHDFSPWGNLAQGLICWKVKEVDNATIYLRKGCELLAANMEMWLLFLNFLVEVNDYARIESTSRKLQIMLQRNDSISLPSSITSLDSFNQSLKLTQATALLHLGYTNHLIEAFDILQEIPDKTMSVCTMLIKALIKLKRTERASKDLEDFKKRYGESQNTQELSALLARACGNKEEAKRTFENILQQNTSSDETLFQLGRIYFEEMDYQKSFIYMLKAAKINAKNGLAFLYIGHYYKISKNLVKARKCFEKAFNLCPFDEEIGAALSDVYRISEDHTNNVNLLLRVTQETGRGSGGWAWLRLGLHHMSHFNLDKAVQCFQCAVELNSLDRICFECLGDAYLARGSHTAALKVFRKAMELDPNEAIYSKCMIAHINWLIGELLLSISEYEEVIAENPPSAVKTVALVGLAQVLISRAKGFKRQILLERLKDDCLYAIDCLARAADESSNNLTVWKLLGDACTLQSNVPYSQSTFMVPKRLLDSTETDLNVRVQMNKDELLSLGARCYGVGLRISDRNASLWHDLGANLFLQGFIHLKLTKGTKFSSEDGDRFNQDHDFIERAIAALKKSVTLDPHSENAWNSLGVAANYNGDFGFAQHCFIRCLSIQPIVQAWTNLGALYLSHENVYLAHEAFTQAQALDPEYIECWVGQAMVADAVEHYETFDLYRHTTLLGIHPESCLGFAYKVLKVACNPLESNIQFSNATSMLTNVSDSLQFYCREKEMDVVALNMCGTTLEMLGLKQSAAQVYEKAVEVFKEETVPRDMQDIILLNYSRLLTNLGRLNEANHYFSQIEEPDFYSQCAVAITKIKADQFDEAYQKYTEALVWLANDDIQKSYVLVALAFLQYKYKNIEQVKTLLFQSSTIIQGLLALTALGLLQSDNTLTSAAMAELEPYSHSKEHIYNVTFLKATQATLQGDYHKAKVIFSRALHCHPENSALWRSFAQHLLSMEVAHSTVPLQHIAIAAKNAAAAAITLAQAAGDHDNIAQDVVMKVLSYLKVANVSSKRKKQKLKILDKCPQLQAIKEAQRSVLMCPHQPETWAVLSAAIGPSKWANDIAQLWSCKADEKLKSWFMKNTAINVK